MSIEPLWRLRHCAWPAFAALLFTTAALAQEQQDLTILGSTANWPTGRVTFVSETDVEGLRIRHTRVDDESCGTRDFLEINGPLGSGTQAVIEPFLSAMQPCGGGGSRGTVILSSGGGVMTDGYGLGTLLAQYGVAAALVQGQVCASACVAAFLGGSPRYMLESAWLVLQSPARRPGIGIDCENTQEVTALKDYFIARLGSQNGGLLHERAMSNCSAARGWTIQPQDAVALGIIEADNAPFTQQLADRSLNFMADNAARSGVITTASGLQYEVISRSANTDAQGPTATSRVTVNYHGTFVDGRVFDSSVERGRPATFPLNQVIRGWTEGLQLMRPGDKFRFFIPPELAYGEAGRGPVPANTPLIFEIELLEIGGAN